MGMYYSLVVLQKKCSNRAIVTKLSPNPKKKLKNWTHETRHYIQNTLSI